MSNSIDNQVVMDMEECFRSFDLPVYKNKNTNDNDLAFTSQICNDHVCADVFATYDTQIGYVGIDFSFRDKVPSEKMPEILQLLNLLNGYRPLYGFSVCQRCNTISLRSDIFLSTEILPRDEFKRLISDILEDVYLCSPLIKDVVDGGNYKELHDRFMEGHKDILNMGSKPPRNIDGKILSDMESVITDLKIHINNKDRTVNEFISDLKLDEMVSIRMSITLSHENKIVVLYAAPPFNVPNEKMTVVTELVNLINRMVKQGHLYIYPQTNRVHIIKGIIIDNGGLDKKEFEMSIRTLLGNSRIFFPIITEQLSSNESPEFLLAKINKNHEACCKTK